MLVFFMNLIKLKLFDFSGSESCISLWTEEVLKMSVNGFLKHKKPTKLLKTQENLSAYGYNFQFFSLLGMQFCCSAASADGTFAPTHRQWINGPPTFRPTCQ
jgi:hypothetical protein